MTRFLLVCWLLALTLSAHPSPLLSGLAHVRAVMDGEAGSP